MKASDLYPIVKRLKISQSYLSKEMGYSKVYISKIMNGHMPGEKKFHKLLVTAIAKRAKRDYTELLKALEGTEWIDYLP
jgi:transcriptional regulator with XRE-family HTH domain